MALVHTNGKIGEPYSFEDEYVKHAWDNAMEICSKPIVELMIDFKIALDGSIEEYREKVVGFPQREGTDLDDILALITRGFYWKEGFELVEDFASMVRGFEVHGRDTHV